MSQPPSDNVDARLKAAEDQLRGVMLALPETTEEFPWGHRTAKVKGKMFVILALDNDGLGVTTKLPESHEAALTLPFTEPTGYGLGKSGWVSSRFKPGSEVPIGLLSQWIHESFRAVAPQKVLKALTAPGAARAPKAKPGKAATPEAQRPSAGARKKPAAAKRVAGAGRGGAAKPAVGGKKSVAKPASAREGPKGRAGAKTSTAKRGAAGSSR
ncbi:MmcQ/YjbR family DNA-binding protein [Myxococcus sp. SDU36]|uniref:MmcQ/YjbR family DNA-binding protein n=1 Tax=Myxococcus sp. SDU36 TaxID=2831967 RepID=UPI002542FBD7|nr:MmcQ/YjbR family DNA-binding protein [Myxococcus sp. SDU36]WIG93338.1 MmcQ/YjbR family DNA-binding protein [Myxococcus sp. SDU36]